MSAREPSPTDASTRAYVYFEPKHAQWAQRWLEQHTDRRVTLVAARADEAAKALVSKFAHVDGPLSLEEVRESGAAITIPVTLKSKRLDFYPDTVIPDLKPVHETLVNLRRAGFRTFHLSNSSGEFTLELNHWFDEFRNRHQGKRCFVLGNGPSLNRLDMGLLKNEITIGANRCYLGYEKWGFECTYWTVSDRLQIERYGNEHAGALSAETVKFVPFDYLPVLNPAGACPVRMEYARKPFFANDSTPIYIGHSVMIPMLQIAAYMGCNPIVMVGVDHRFDLQGKRGDAMRRLRSRLIKPFRQTLAYETIRHWRGERAARRRGKAGGFQAPTRAQELWDAKHAAAPTHFDERYTNADDRQFLMPEMREATKDFHAADRIASGRGITILNATPGTALHAFPKISFESLF